MKTQIKIDNVENDYIIENDEVVAKSWIITFTDLEDNKVHTICTASTDDLDQSLEDFSSEYCDFETFTYENAESNGIYDRDLIDEVVRKTIELGH